MHCCMRHDQLKSEGELLAPAKLPSPDLSFLQARPSLSSLLSAHMQTTADKITLQLTDVLLALFNPLPQAAPVRSVSGRYTDVIHILTPEHVPELALPFSLTAYRDSQHADLCLLEINVSPPGISWPDLEGYVVQLTYADQVRDAKTDDWGTAVLTDIPINQLPELLITIEPPTGQQE